jgi:molybdopterin-guanine dinucleotide biosynthesis protein A
MTSDVPWTAIVLTGGQGRRLGDVDKAGVLLGDRTSLDRVLDALAPDVPVVVAGPPRSVHRPVAFRGEQPPGGGPVAGIAAALGAVTTPYVGLIATDMPWAGGLLAGLVDQVAQGDVDAVLPVTPDQRRQPLCSAWSTDGLRDCLARLGDPRDRAVRELLALARVRQQPVDAAAADLLADVDTPEDLRRARAWVAAPRLERGERAGPKEEPMDEWIDAVRLELGLDAAVDVPVILDMARVAAHNVARPAAPVTAYLLGIAVANGADLREATRLVESLAEGWSSPEPARAE